jgi:hypothetical protein
MKRRDSQTEGHVEEAFAAIAMVIRLNQEVLVAKARDARLSHYCHQPIIVVSLSKKENSGQGLVCSGYHK